MFSLKHKLPIWAMGAFYLMGTIVNLFLWDPEHGKALLTGATPGGVPWNPVVVIGGTLFNLAVLAGWLYLMFGKEQLRPRLHWFWTSFGVLIIAWIWSTFYHADLLEKGVKLEVFLTTSPEVWSATAFGLLLAFYSLASARIFWYFCWPLFWAGLVMYGAELPKLFGMAGVSWSPYLKPEEAGRFWHYWGWFFTDAYIVPVGLVAMYHTVRLRRKILAQENERHPLFWGFWEGIGLPYVLIWRSLKKIFKK